MTIEGYKSHLQLEYREIKACFDDVKQGNVLSFIGLLARLFHLPLSMIHTPNIFCSTKSYHNYKYDTHLSKTQILQLVISTVVYTALTVLACYYGFKSPIGIKLSDFLSCKTLLTKTLALKLIPLIIKALGTLMLSTLIGDMFLVVCYTYQVHKVRKKTAKQTKTSTQQQKSSMAESKNLNTVVKKKLTKFKIVNELLCTISGIIAICVSSVLLTMLIHKLSCYLSAGGSLVQKQAIYYCTSIFACGWFLGSHVLLLFIILLSMFMDPTGLLGKLPDCK